MAGHRRAIDGRPGKPTQAQARAERRKGRLTDRLAQARTSVDRLAAAYDYARAALADADPHTADTAVHDLINTLVGVADQVTTDRRR
ncbi:MAG: hypothetical protein ACRD0P_31735 [Stackebrandtia sp.]